MNTSTSSGIVDYSFPMWSKKHVGNWLDAFKPRRGSRSSISSSSSGSSSAPSSRKSSRSSSLASLFSRGTAEEQERLMPEVKRTPYVPKYAAKSFMRTTTTHEIRINSEIL
ncbi:hypothetical protein CMUS01_05395 [Colletotrichum musicola]|uniref:Uncharacterized protein n=3 Tax=Colletotrichum orchidearum species complex TaxID=2707337 RepID=A0A8H6KS37_9PEZI|nr:hypothetical protein CSOJ01_11958 [Colletotrichum sojae]KAF6829793.1 hypothetical protein CPLU01_07751 [Colletotrichum plurivorum]KAF6836500.1 hypothetical protein CMUS01_05395 [Colletotrichum musicola]